MSISSPTNDARTTGPQIFTSVVTVVPGCAPSVLIPSAPRDQWWHSQPVATFLSALPTSTPLALTTVYTYPTECVDRWILSPLPLCASFPALGNTAAGNRTVFSINPTKGIVSDPRYNSCQRFSTPTYSPGICPDGHTVAEVTASLFSASSSVKTFWQASCCKSGMTVGPEYPTACISHIATRVRAHDLVTLHPDFASAGATPAYEFIIPTQTSLTISNIIIVTAGIAVADPIVVGWQADDLTQFPADYTSSLRELLAKGPNWTQAISTSKPDPALQSKSAGLSTRAKVGISVGIALGVLLMVLGILVILLRKRRRRIATSERQDASDAEDEDNKHTEHWWNLGGRLRSEMHVKHVQHEVDSRTSRTELDSKIMKNELDSTVVTFELDSKNVLNELDSRAVYVVPGSPAELTSVVSEKHIELREGALH